MRAQNRKKKAGGGKKDEDDKLTPQQKRERDAERLKQKIAMKEQQKGEGSSTSQN